MRWLALVLLLLNSVVWFQATRIPTPGFREPTDNTGVLPRVADLRPPGGQVRALSDDGGKNAPSEDLASAKNQPETAKKDSSPVGCYRLRWFASRESADSFRERYLPGAVVQELERELEPLQWVIIPPRPPAQAQALLRELQMKRIDSYLVREGEYRNAISLGLFENPAFARRVLEQRKSQNLNAVLAKFPRNQLSYALDFEPDRDPDSGSWVVPDLWRGNPLNLIEIESCEGVASAEKNP